MDREGKKRHTMTLNGAKPKSCHVIITHQLLLETPNKHKAIEVMPVE